MKIIFVLLGILLSTIAHLANAELSEPEKAAIVQEILNGNVDVLDYLAVKPSSDAKPSKIEKAGKCHMAYCYTSEECCSKQCASFIGSTGPGWCS